MARDRNRRAFVFWLLCRVVWAVMLALHAHWFARSFNSPDTWYGQQFALFVAGAFFAMKMIDLSALRVRMGRREFVACTLAVALLHGGVIERAIDAETSAGYFALPLLAAAAPLCMKLSLRGVIRQLMRIAALIGHIPLVWTRTFWHYRTSLLMPVHQRQLIALSPPRAPPV